MSEQTLREKLEAAIREANQKSGGHCAAAEVSEHDAADALLPIIRAHATEVARSAESEDMWLDADSMRDNPAGQGRKAVNATREQVYAAIDSEREYQEQRWERPKHNHSRTEYLVYIRHYVEQAFAAVSTQDGESGADAPLRKIAALSVAAMEEHGPVARTNETKGGKQP